MCRPTRADYTAPSRTSIEARARWSSICRVTWLRLALLLLLASSVSFAHAAELALTSPSRPPLLPAPFWNQQRRGANCQNRQVTPEYWPRGARRRHRVHPTHSRRMADQDRDFLMGSADAFDTLNVEDLATLRRVLDDAHGRAFASCSRSSRSPARDGSSSTVTATMRVCGPSRSFARRHWRSGASSPPSSAASGDRAYNPLNEPHPERAFGLVDPDSAEFVAWHRDHRGTPADLNASTARWSLRSARPIPTRQSCWMAGVMVRRAASPGSSPWQKTPCSTRSTTMSRGSTCLSGQ